ncbi:MAG: hypothetical protein RR201_00535 [Malacoplasma sp.]
MIKEMGSEFCEEETAGMIQLQQNENIRYLLSGRTALGYIIKDMMLTKKIKKAYLPSYCCHTMIEPFIKSNIQIEFYDVLFLETNELEYKIDTFMPCDVVYLIEYFGFSNKFMTDISKKFKLRGITVIEDITHSMLKENKNYKYVDYIFGSFRKWTSLYSGGFAYKCDGVFKRSSFSETNHAYIKLRKESVEIKKKYMNGFIKEKEYLKTFEEAEKLLEIDYTNYSMDQQSFEQLKKKDVKNIKEKRIKNGSSILKNIQDSKIMQPMYKSINSNDVPLFIPVIVRNGYRDELREYLISNKIYSPIHWPLSRYHLISEEAKYIYNNEISIICDQRYGLEEINDMENVLKNFEVMKCL